MPLPLPAAVPTFNRRVVNPVLRHLAGADRSWRSNTSADAPGRPTTLDLSQQQGLSRMPTGPRPLLPVLGCHDFVELPVLDERPWRGAVAPA